jgi:DNA-binding transcriptional LysR family regulator
MARESGLDRATIFQLRSLAEAVKFGDYGRAASEMGIPDKHRLIKAVERLNQNLGIELGPDLSQRVGDEPVVPEDVRKTVDEFLAAYDELAKAIDLRTGRAVLIRALAFPVMITNFMADAVSRFENRADVQAEIRFTEMDVRYRLNGTAGVLSHLASRHVDVAVGPSPDAVDSERVAATLKKRQISQTALYRWRLTAAVHKHHPVLDDPIKLPDGTFGIDVARLRSYPLLTSPRGHHSRDLLALFQPLDQIYDIELETPETEARVALGRTTDRVPLIASDAPATYEAHWLPVVAWDKTDGYVTIGGEHSVYWRTDITNRIIKGFLCAFVQDVYDSADLLRARPGGALNGDDGP